MLCKGDQKSVLYKGDYAPAMMGKGANQIAGYTEQEHSGTDWTVETVYKDNLRPEILGVSRQRSTTGKNLIKLNNAVIKQSLSTVISLPPGTYTFSAEVTNDAGKPASGFIFGTGTNVTRYSYSIPADGLRHSITFTASENLTWFHLYGWIGYVESAGITASWKNMQIELGSSATPYEPYTGGAPSPSPDYPPPILSSGGSNVYVNDRATPLPDGFGGIEEYRDRLYVSEGKAWWEKRTVESELEIEPGGGETYWNVVTGSGKIEGDKRLLISHFPKSKFLYNGNYKFIFTGLKIMANYGFTKKQDLIDFIATQHAAGTPVTIRYALASSVTIDITATPTGAAMLAASTAPGTVHVYSDADDNVKPTITAKIKLPD